VTRAALLIREQRIVIRDPADADPGCIAAIQRAVLGAARCLLARIVPQVAKLLRIRRAAAGRSQHPGRRVYVVPTKLRNFNCDALESGT
jgi:hypothetical protein